MQLWHLFIQDESIVKEPPKLKEKKQSITIEEDTEISDLTEDDEEAPLLKRLKRDSENSSIEPFIIPAKKKFQKVPSKSMSLPTATTPKGELIL